MAYNNYLYPQQLTPAQRLAAMEQQQQQFQQMQYMPQQTPVQANPTYALLKGRPVSSLEEARASMIDFDGTLFYFPDTANQKIYTKQINLDGTSSLKVYEQVETPLTVTPSELPTDTYVSREEFAATISSLVDEIKILKGVEKPDESKSDTAYQF